MFVAMTAMIVSVTELSNVLSVVAVLICFCAMFLLIMKNMTVFWLQGDDFMFSSSVHHVQQQIPQMKMMKVHIPFTFRLNESSMDSCTGVTCTISSQVPYRLEIFWGVSIRELHLFLWRPWSVINTAVQNDTLLRGHYQYREHCIFERSNHAEKTVSMRLPAECLDLGTPPRLYYPLVILLIRDNPVNVHPDQTVALVNVVHIKDSVCTLPTSILAQYLKQANGQLSSLKQLYLATGNSSTYDDSDMDVELPLIERQRSGSLTDGTRNSNNNNNNNSNNNNNNNNNSRSTTTADGGGPVVMTAAHEQLCVVCQYFPLSRALIPCRHTCICAVCFSKLENCPMCRSPIKSYFCVRGEEYLSDCNSIEKPANTKSKSFSQWIQDSITDFLGFRR